MQKLRLQNTYNKDTKSFDKNNFELRESDKTLTGKVSISSKKDGGYISKSIPFVAFKSQISSETEYAIRNSKGKSFEASFNIAVDKFDVDGKETKFFRLVINEAKFQEVDNQNNYGNPSLGVDEESIPF